MLSRCQTWEESFCQLLLSPKPSTSAGFRKALDALSDLPPDYSVYPPCSSQTHADPSILESEMTRHCKQSLSTWEREPIIQPLFVWSIYRLQTSQVKECVCTVPSTRGPWSLMEHLHTSEILIYCLIKSSRCSNSCINSTQEKTSPNSSCLFTMGILPGPRTTLTSTADKVGMARNIICAWQSVRPHKHLVLFVDSVRNITLETQLHQEAPIQKQSVDGQVSIGIK